MLFKDILRFYLVFVTQELIAFENDTLKLGGTGTECLVQQQNDTASADLSTLVSTLCSLRTEVTFPY